MQKQWEVWRKGENSRAVYYGCGPTITVTRAMSTRGYRCTCLTCLNQTCEHVRAVERYVSEPVSRPVTTTRQEFPCPY